MAVNKFNRPAQQNLPTKQHQVKSQRCSCYGCPLTATSSRSLGLGEFFCRYHFECDSSEYDLITKRIRKNMGDIRKQRTLYLTAQHSAATQKLQDEIWKAIKCGTIKPGEKVEVETEMRQITQDIVNNMERKPYAKNLSA